MYVFAATARVLHLFADGVPRGSWSSYRHWDGRDTYAVICPTCDHAFCVVNHQIGTDGSVSPSVVCPHQGCTFHEFVRFDLAPMPQLPAAGAGVS